MVRVKSTVDYSSHSVSVFDSLRYFTKNVFNRVPNTVNEALIHALCASGGYRTTDDIHLSRADVKMNLLTSGFLRTLNERVLSPVHYNNFEFRWIRHQGMIRLSLLYYDNKRSMPKIVPGRYIVNMKEFDLDGYKKLLHKMENVASFLYIGAKQRELSTGAPVLTFKASRIDFMKPYVKDRLASNFAYKHIYDKVNNVAYVDKVRTNIARFVIYFPLFFIPVIGWLIIYVSEKYNAMNSISASLGPYSDQLNAAENFANRYAAMDNIDKKKYHAVARKQQLVDLESLSDEELSHINNKLFNNKGNFLDNQYRDNKVRQGNINRDHMNKVRLDLSANKRDATDNVYNKKNDNSSLPDKILSGSDDIDIKHRKQEVRKNHWNG